MLKIQKILHPTQKKVRVSAKVVDFEVGFSVGAEVNVMSKDDILVFTKCSEIKGFEFVKKAKVFSSQGNAQASLGPKWVREHMGDNKNLRVYYTRIGIFIRPFEGGMLNDLIV